MKVEDNRRVYEGEDAFSSAVLVSLYATKWASELGIGRDSYAVVFVSLAVGIIYKYQNLSPWVSVVWLSFFYQLCTYTTFKHLVRGQAT